jgi:hypothetical protein
MEETSNASFNYPMLRHAVPTATTDANNEFNSTVVWTDSDSDSVIDSFVGGPWRGEELLLTNVHAFDIKVWDETLNGFVDIGHTLTTTINGNPVNGDFHIARCKNTFFGPAGAVGGTNRVFDTWYPFRTEDIDGDGTLDDTEDTDGDGILDSGEDTDTDGVLDDLAEDGGTAGERDGQLLDFDASGGVTLLDNVGVGAIDAGENVPPYRPLVATPVKPNPSGGRLEYERWVANTSSTAASRYAVGNRIFPSIRPYKAQFGDPFYYICVGTNDINMDGTISHAITEPTWQRTAGLKTYDGELIWQAVDNRKPLRAIQITLRFLDPTTSQLRTLTLQHSLVD